MNCPECNALLQYSFVDDVTLTMVYRCPTTGVEAFQEGNRWFYTKDCSTLFFIRKDGQLFKVKPVRMSRSQSNVLFKSRGFPPYRDEETRTEEYPVGWTTAVA